MYLFRELEEELDENCKGIFWNEKTKLPNMLVIDKGEKLFGPLRLVEMPFKIKVFSG